MKLELRGLAFWVESGLRVLRLRHTDQFSSDVTCLQRQLLSTNKSGIEQMHFAIATCTIAERVSITLSLSGKINTDFRLPACGQDVLLPCLGVALPGSSPQQRWRSAHRHCQSHQVWTLEKFFRVSASDQVSGAIFQKGKQE